MPSNVSENLESIRWVPVEQCDPSLGGAKKGDSVSTKLNGIINITKEI